MECNLWARESLHPASYRPEKNTYSMFHVLLWEIASAIEIQPQLSASHSFTKLPYYASAHLFGYCHLSEKGWMEGGERKTSAQNLVFPTSALTIPPPTRSVAGTGPPRGCEQRHFLSFLHWNESLAEIELEDQNDCSLSSQRHCFSATYITA